MTDTGVVEIIMCLQEIDILFNNQNLKHEMYVHMLKNPKVLLILKIMKISSIGMKSHLTNRSTFSER